MKGLADVISFNYCVNIATTYHSAAHINIKLVWMVFAMMTKIRRAAEGSWGSQLSRNLAEVMVSDNILL